MSSKIKLDSRDITPLLRVVNNFDSVDEPAVLGRKSIPRPGRVLKATGKSSLQKGGFYKHEAGVKTTKLLLKSVVVSTESAEQTRFCLRPLTGLRLACGWHSG
jgi:hypothetical protein